MDEALYDEMAASERTYWWFVAKRRIIHSLIARYLAPSAAADASRPVALDIGCGTGAMLEELETQGFETVGCDSHPASLQACHSLSLEVLSGTLPDDLPFDRESFDVVILSDVLEHVEQDAASVASVTSLLKPGGILICTVPAHPWMWTSRDELHHHKRRYRRREFRRLFDLPELSEILFSYYNSALFPLMIAARIVSRVTRSDEEPDIKPLPAPINALLRSVFEIEKTLLGRLPFPPGGSLISVHRRVDRQRAS
jgi:SAM-dependent methyltransferase